MSNIKAIRDAAMTSLDGIVQAVDVLASTADDLTELIDAVENVQRFEDNSGEEYVMYDDLMDAVRFFRPADQNKLI